LRTGINIGQLISLDDAGVDKMARELVAPWNTSFEIKLDDVIAELKQEKTKLSELISQEVVEIVGDDFAQNVYKE